MGRKGLSVTAIFLVGVLCGWVVHSRQSTGSPALLPIRENSSVYHFTNPLLLINITSKNAFTNRSIEKSLQNYVRKINPADASRVSVYFHDLNSGKWTGVNEDEVYAPASMLKVVILLAYLKNPALLIERVEYNKNLALPQYYKPSRVLSNGYHTVRELIIAMVVDSDNAAMFALIAKHREAVLDVYASLRLPDPSVGPDDFMSAKSYSAVFRTLYNSTYLRREYSEQALELLTHTSFTKGLVAGVGTSTVIAHKFGEHTAYDQSGNVRRELHDCGIVYYPEKPYFLCVMTEGNDFGKLEKIIADLSRIAYENVTE